MAHKIKKILIADDDSTILQLFTEAFSATEFHVLTAKDGVEALKLLNARHASIDVLLADVVMPQMNGSELARITLTRHPETRIIFISGHSDSVLEHYGIPASEMRLIKKPISPIELVQTVRDELYR